MAAPCAIGDVVGPDHGELHLPDGVVLVADIYRPAGAGPWPVLLMRQPYGRRIASTVVLAHPSWYAAQGYIVVVQDVRGCGDSGGRFEPFVNEAADGAASVAWARTLPGANGRLGMYGFSYQASTQYLALAGGARPDALAPAMGSWHPGQDWLRTGGLLRTAQSVGWAVQMARLSAAHGGDDALLAELSPAHGWQQHYASLVARPDLSALHHWAADNPAWWAQAAPALLLRDTPLAIPVLHVAGLSDFLLGGSLDADAAFRATAGGTSHLILGPWAHMPWNRGPAGGAAAISLDKAHIAFFDHYLKGLGPRPAALRCYDLTRDRWDDAQDWPGNASARLHPGSSGLAAAHLGDGRLGDLPSTGCDRLVHDPTRPVPLIGGAAGLPAGPVDRAAIDDRADVATYDTAPFARDVRLLGRPRLTVQITADAERFVCAASLSLIQPDGAARVLATAATLGPAPLSFDLGAVSATVPRGASVRLSLQGAAEPAFAIPPDQFHRFAGASRPVTLTIHHAGSHLTLPAPLQEERPA